MECEKCGTLIEEGVFCPTCGSRVDGKKVCPNCEKLIPCESIFCSYCGTKLTKDEPNNDVSKKEEVEEKKAEELPIIIPVAVPSITQVDTIEKDTIVAPEEVDDVAITEAIICTQCGSTDVEIISEDLGKCKNCGTQVVINMPKETSVVTNNVNIQMVESFGEAPLSFFEMPLETTQEDFFVKALLNIANKKDSPDDVFSVSNFKPIKKIYCQYLIGEGNVDMTYSATIGYDRKEEYYEQVRRWDSSIKDYRYTQEKRTRTVTDWSPFSSTYKGTHIGTANNDDQEESAIYDYFSNCSKKAIIYDAKSSKTPAPLPPTNQSIEDLERNIKIKASSYCELSLPGDHSKDFHSSGDVSLTKIESHVAPRYVLNYSYKGKKYNAGAHSVEESIIFDNTPSAASENEKEIENDKLVKSFNLITFFTLLFAILSAIAFPIIALKILFTVVAIVLFVINCVVKAKRAKEIYTLKQIKKKKDLIKLLKEKGIKIPEQLNKEV